MKRSLEIDPLSVFHNSALGVVLLFARQYEAASEQLRKSLEMDPSYAYAHLWLASTLFHSGRYDEAIAEMQKGLAMSGGDMWMRCVLCSMLAFAGHRETALAQLQEILSLGEHHYLSPVHLSQVYLGLGDFDRVFELLERGFQERDPALHVALIALPVFRDTAGRDPRFQDLVSRIRSFSASSHSSAA